MNTRTGLLTLILAMSISTALAGEADVENVKILPNGSNSWTFQVTVRHADEGWDHYADRWEILAPDGKILSTRVLAHPHVNEQPFTRSLSGTTIPDNITSITIRAHDKVHGYGGKTITLPWPPADK